MIKILSLRSKFNGKPQIKETINQNIFLDLHITIIVLTLKIATALFTSNIFLQL